MKGITDLETIWQLHDEMVIACRKCPRLVAWREQIAIVKRRAYQDQVYWGKPVPGFGDLEARLLVVGLAPGAHGANRTGRIFTGDASGDFLFNALFEAGFANQPTSHDRNDGLMLKDVYITAVCRCAPPQNKPMPDEVNACIPYLQEEIENLINLTGIVALGKIAFENILRIFQQGRHSVPRLEFTHGGVYNLGTGLPWLLASYHPSRQNTQTGRLTAAMFAQIWTEACKRLGEV